MFEIEKIKNVLNGKQSVSSLFLITLCVFFIIIFDNASFWSSLLSVIELSSWNMYLFLIACFSFIFVVCFILFSVLGVSVFLKPVIAFTLLLASVSAFYMDNYGIIFDKNMIRNIAETDFHEMIELFSADIIWHVLLSGVLPIVLMYRISVKQKPFIKEAGLRLLAMFVVVTISTLLIYTSYKDFTFVFRENREVSFFANPVYPIRSAYQFSRDTIRASNKVFSHVFQDAHKINSAEFSEGLSKTKNILVMVVGETARDQSFHIDGYSRETTPELEKRNVIHFMNTWSCGTATAVSLPCMFSNLKHENFDNGDARNQQNLMDALDIAGINVMWRENNSGCKGVCDRIETQEYKDIYIEDFCDNEGCYDEALLNHLGQYLSYLKDDSVIVLHTQGSHGPAYYRRYPEKFSHFQPECRRVSVQNCTDEEVKNSYDNTILYTDYFLSKVIDFLSSNPDTKNSAMIYVSDHGESLGENGVYLHGLPYMVADDYQKHIPMIMWVSDGFAGNKYLDTSCLILKENARYSHDNFIHSILGIMDIDSVLYDKKLDLFASCRYKPIPSNTYIRASHNNSEF
ncbi:Phosphoethanolamine transferase EptA [hydrothermal vent metagenome]|uniref:Phosphoethanolamine transferase EptA n=1 Tax=hydrothermal vent metagenome TaxID=652676 RepID=A0A3B0W3S2_9ZZZZ